MSLFAFAFSLFFFRISPNNGFNLKCINKVQSTDTLESKLKSNSTITLTHYVTSLGDRATHMLHLLQIN